MIDKTLFFLWLVVAGLLVTVPAGARAATLGDGDYARIGVPNLGQASAFFQDVLDCRLVGDSPTSDARATNSLLLSCGVGSMLELYVDPGISPARRSHAAGEPLQFLSDDVLLTDAWLRRRGVVVSGAPHRLATGRWAGRMAVDFAAPWGLRLRLLGSRAAEPVDDARRTAAAPRTRGH